MTRNPADKRSGKLAPWRRGLVAVPMLGFVGLALHSALLQWRYQAAAAAGNLEAAAAAWPAQSAAWRGIAEQLVLTDPKRAAAAGRHAVADDPQYWENWASLAAAQYDVGDVTGARVSMANMVRHARGYFAHWRYANLLLLMGDRVGFWENATIAVAFLPSDQFDDAFSQLLAVDGGDYHALATLMEKAQSRSPDPDQRAALGVEFFGWLVAHGQSQLAAPWWRQVLHAASSSVNRSALQSAGWQYLQLLLGESSEDSTAAVEQAWREGLGAGLFDSRLGPTPGNLVSNPDFAAALDAGPLEWRSCRGCAPWISRLGDNAQQGALEAPALSLAFHGDSADQVGLLSETLLVRPRTRYQLQFRSRAAAGLAGSGVYVDIAQSGQVLVRVPAQLEVGWRKVQAVFATGADSSPALLRIEYERPLGQLPLSGHVELSGFSLAPAATNAPATVLP